MINKSILFTILLLSFSVISMNISFEKKNHQIVHNEGISDIIDLEIFARLNAAILVASKYNLQNDFHRYASDFSRNLRDSFSLLAKKKYKRFEDLFKAENNKQQHDYQTSDNNFDNLNQNNFNSFNELFQSIDEEVLQVLRPKYDEIKIEFLLLIKTVIADTIGGNHFALEEYSEIFNSTYESLQEGWLILQQGGMDAILERIVQGENWPCEIYRGLGLCGWYCTIGLMLQSNVSFESAINLFQIEDYPHSIGNPFVFKNTRLKKLSLWLKINEEGQIEDSNFIKTIIPGIGLGLDSQGYSHPGALLSDIIEFSGVEHSSFDDFDICHEEIINILSNNQPVFVLIFRQQDSYGEYHNVAHYINILSYEPISEQYIVMDLSSSSLRFICKNVLKDMMSSDFNGEAHWILQLQDYANKAKIAHSITNKIFSCNCEESEACIDCAMNDIKSLSLLKDMHIGKYNIFYFSYEKTKSPL